MVEQIADRNGFAVRRKFREEVGEVVVVVELAVANQEHDARRRELLGERCQPEVGLPVDGMESTEIGDAVAAAEDHLTAMDYQDGGAGSGGGFQGGEDGIDLPGWNLGKAWRWQGQRDEQWERTPSRQGNRPLDHAVGQ